jgi:hypothetical protein
MKRLFGILMLMFFALVMSCEKDKCYVCETRTDVGTTLEASTSKDVYLSEMEIGPRFYESQNSSVVVKDIGGGPYYSQTITKCREK